VERGERREERGERRKGRGERRNTSTVSLACCRSCFSSIGTQYVWRHCDSDGRSTGMSLLDVFIIKRFNFFFTFRLGNNCEGSRLQDLNRNNLIQWAPLNGITDNRINRLIASNLSRMTRPKLLFHTQYRLKLICLLESVGYWNQFVSVPK
jgi:hypothetical protein